MCYCIVWSLHCFSLTVVYYDSICWRYFTNALCTIYYSLNCFGLLAFFSRVAPLYVYKFLLLLLLFLIARDDVLFYVMKIRLFFLLKKLSPKSSQRPNSTHVFHPTLYAFDYAIELYIIFWKKLPFAVDYSLSALVYIFYPNPIAKNRLKTAQKYHFELKKKKSWMMSIHCSLREDHICMILVNLRLHAQICPDLQTIGVDLRASITQQFLCFCCIFLLGFFFTFVTD